MGSGVSYMGAGQPIETYDRSFNRQIFEAVENNSICLDVGSWTGNLGKALIDEKNCIVDGIDYNKKALEQAINNGYRKTFLVDLNNDGLDRHIEEKYDFIICADVLEHLVNPDVILSQLKPFVKSHGQILISVPNIAFIQQRLKLLFGIFEYDLKGGIMDATHLRFFTLSSIKKLCTDAGYDVVKSFGYAQVKRKVFSFLSPLAKTWPRLFAFQFLLRVKLH